MKHLILISSILIASYKVPYQKITYKNSYYKFYIDTSRYTILRFNDQNNRFSKGCKPTILTSTDVKKIETLILKTITEYNKKSNSSWQIKHVESYYKQLIAVINLNGEKEVWANCLCNVDDFGPSGPNWKHDVVDVMDGGSCYFNLKINLSKGTVYDFSVNGVG